MRLIDLLASPDWWATILAAEYAHCTSIFVLPVCETVIENWKPTLASAFFVAAIALVVFEHDLWPPRLRCPPPMLLLLYEVKINNILFIYVQEFNVFFC